MNSYFIEWRPLRSKSISWDIAHHLHVRQFQGSVVIVTERPDVLLPALRKQWNRIVRQTQRERARTLNLGLIAELEGSMEHTKQLQFSAEKSKTAAATRVLFITPEQIAQISCKYSTLYLAAKVSASQMGTVKHVLEPHGLLIIYPLAQAQNKAH